MKNMIKYTVMIIPLILLITNCSDFPAPERYDNDYFMVNGLLKEGEPITPENPILITKTIDVESGNINEIFPDSIISQVRVTEKETGDFIDLQPFTVDSLGMEINLFYYDTSFEFIIESEKTYRLSISLDSGDSIWAETTVPKHIELKSNSAFSDSLTDTLPELDYDNANTDHPLRIECSTDETIQLYFKFYCLEEYYNAEYITDYGDEDTPEDEYDYEDPVDGSPRKITWYSYYKPALENSTYFITDSGYKSNLLFYGRYSITTLSIDDNYFKYLYKPEGFNHGGIESNNDRAKGYFGSASGNTIYTKVVE